MQGERNPFWGKSHGPEMRERIKAGRRANPPMKRRGGRPKGSFTAEERAAISARMKEDWKRNRDRRLSLLLRGEDHPYHKLQHEKRYRKCFTPFQRREWTADKCLWCDSTESLTLDHIIPVMAGGTNDRSNAQTLCHPCNLWKMRYVDRPYYFASLGSQGGCNQP